MLPKTSPNWSLKLTPCTLDGRSPLMSFTLLRTWTQISGTRLRGRVVLEIDEDRGLARGRVALGVVERVELLQLALDAVGDLVGHLHDRGAGPARIDHHALDGEGGILLAAEPRVGQAARHHDQQHQVPDEGAMLQRPGREVEAVHCGTLTVLAGREAVHAGNDDALARRDARGDDDAVALARADGDFARCDHLVLLRPDRPPRRRSCRPSRAAPSPAGRHARRPAG